MVGGLHTRLMGTGENAVVRVGPFVVRIARDGSRMDDTRTEVAWLHALRDADVPAPWPLGLSHIGNPRAMTFPELSGERTVTVFLYDPGRPLGTPTMRDTVRAAQLLSRIHEQAEGYTPPDGLIFRRAPDAFDFSGRYDDEGAIAGVEATLGGGDVLRRAVRRYRAWSAGQSRPLIHGDFHGGNLLRSPKGKISALDFDGCGHAPRLYDVAAYSRELRTLGLGDQRGAFIDVSGLGAEDRRDLPIVERFRTAQLVFWIASLRTEPSFAGWWEGWCRTALAELAT